MTAATPAPPLLASILLPAALAHSTLRPAPASSGSATIDEAALAGGFRYGEITAIAGAAGVGKTLLCHHAAASHLMGHPAGSVAFIDTTGTFSPVRLRDVLVCRLRERVRRRARMRHEGFVFERREKEDGGLDGGVGEEAVRMLDRVKVMRVFDLAGVVEAVGEVREMREEAERKDRERRVGMRMMKEMEKCKEVEDSEEEIGDNDEEMEEHEKESPRHTPTLQDVNGKEVEDDGNEPHSGEMGMILIDTIANVGSSLMSKNQTQGQALLTSFMRSLHHLTSNHHICTILTNAAVGMTSPLNLEYQRRPEDNVSIFASTRGKPGLGRTFMYLIDTSIFLSAVPKTRSDAAIAYGERREGQTWQKGFVLEVLKDRCGAREGRWAAFEIADDVKLVPCFA